MKGTRGLHDKLSSAKVREGFSQREGIIGQGNYDLIFLAKWTSFLLLWIFLATMIADQRIIYFTSLLDPAELVSGPE